MKMMSVTFKLCSFDAKGHLYISKPDAPDQGYIAYVLPRKIQSTLISLEQALHQYKGTFVFSLTPLPVTTESDTGKFMKLLQAVLPAPPARWFMWLHDPLAVKATTISRMEINASGRRIASSGSIPINGRRWRFMLPEGLPLALTDNQSIEMSAGRETPIRFAGRQAPAVKDIRKVTIPFTGPYRGCIQINALYINVRSLAGRHKLRTGFQFCHPDGADEGAVRSGWYPLLEQNGSEYIGFAASFDPCAMARGARSIGESGNIRAYLRFTGHNCDGRRTLLNTAYITKLGYPVQMTPIVGSGDDAMLVFHETPGDRGRSTGLMLSPAGKFALSVQDGIGGYGHDLLCGLSGTESLSFESGDFIYYSPFNSAYARSYPFQQTTTRSYPVDEIEQLLRNDYLTSYAVLKPMTPGPAPNTVRYWSQSEGAVLYGSGRITKEFNKMFLDYEQTCVAVRENSPPFPLVPYGRVQEEAGQHHFTEMDYIDFEQKVIALLRRHLLEVEHEEAFKLTDVDFADMEYQATTSSGQLVALNGSRYLKVLLGRSAKPDAPDLSFVRLDEKLQKALQTNQLFLVASSNRYLSASPAEGDGPGFNNRLDIENWMFSIETGTRNQYMDYRDIILIKGRKDTEMCIRDLVAKPEMWTQTNDFSVSADGQSLDASAELAGLSSWLVNYIEDACNQPDPAFENFRSIVNSKNWNGMLILKATLADIPEEVGMLAAGMDPQYMFAHHLGTGSTPVKRELNAEENKASAVFGLIHYVHPHYTPPENDPYYTIDPDPGDFDFKVLYMKVSLFQGAVADFYCLSQLTVNKLFDQPVAGMKGMPKGTHTMLIEGNEERQNGLLSYRFQLKHDYVYHFSSSLLDRVELIGISLSNGQRSQNLDQTAATLYQFNLSGYIAFHACRQKSGTEHFFDVMSFGAELPANSGRRIRLAEPEAARRIGLSFSALSITMKVPDAMQGENSFEADPTRMVFDPTVSTIRQNSLFRSFPLELQGLIVGEGDIGSLGYLPVGVVPQLTGVGKRRWHGLRMRLNLGGLGALAGNAGIDAELLLAWSSDDGNDMQSYNLSVGLKLPSALKRFELQGVVELVFEHLFLRFDEKQGFSLEMNPVALRLLGLKQLPTSGAISMKLFGKDGEKKIGWYALYPTEGS
ncbi:hypothetical protein [Priestia sp. LL-8]|uniref:hypothetical protein n=1 Tax=Priestia sp. LL-8 TaxID=3110068 RepID=UPI002E268C93|nr:hypothetical protein [Priestia sp. LL-8]